MWRPYPLIGEHPGDGSPTSHSAVLRSSAPSPAIMRCHRTRITRQSAAATGAQAVPGDVPVKDSSVVGLAAIVHLPVISDCFRRAVGSDMGTLKGRGGHVTEDRRTSTASDELERQVQEAEQAQADADAAVQRAATERAEAEATQQRLLEE